VPAHSGELEIRLRFAPYYVRGFHDVITLLLAALQARDAGGACARVGDTVAGAAAFSLAWSDCPAGARVRVLANGRLLDDWPAGGSGERGWEMDAGMADWVVVEVRAAEGALLAVTHPIFTVE
jgi:hypothetical protein